MTAIRISNVMMQWYKGQWRQESRTDTYQIQFSQPLRGVGQIYDSIVGEIGAIGQTESVETRERIHTPMLEALVGDGRTSRQVDLLQS